MARLTLTRVSNRQVPNVAKFFRVVFGEAFKLVFECCFCCYDSFVGRLLIYTSFRLSLSKENITIIAKETDTLAKYFVKVSFLCLLNTRGFNKAAKSAIHMV